jgi:hypothetical protein
MISTHHDLLKILNTETVSWREQPPNQLKQAIKCSQVKEPGYRGHARFCEKLSKTTTESAKLDVF